MRDQLIVPPGRNEPGSRKGESARAHREKLARMDVERALLLLLGRDRVLGEIAKAHGNDRALAAAEVFGIRSESYIAGREDMIQRVSQASVNYGPAPDAAARPVADRSKGRVGVDYLDYTEVMTLVAKGYKWDSQQVQDACRYVDDNYLYTPPPGEGANGLPVPVQRSHASTVVRYNADEDDLTSQLPDSPNARRVSVPPMMPSDRSQA